MKNLATCTPSEFLSQTVKIRRSVEKWLTATDISKIRKQIPKFTPEMTDEEKRSLMAEQVKSNALQILDAVCEDHPQETLELLALTCFVPPNEVDSHTIIEYLSSILDMVEDETVLRFFTLLVKLGLKNSFTVPNQ